MGPSLTVRSSKYFATCLETPELRFPFFNQSQSKNLGHSLKVCIAVLVYKTWMVRLTISLAWTRLLSSLWRLAWPKPARTPLIGRPACHARSEQQKGGRVYAQAVVPTRCAALVYSMPWTEFTLCRNLDILYAVAWILLTTMVIEIKLN